MGIGIGDRGGCGCSRLWEAKDEGMRTIYHMLHIEGWGLEIEKWISGSVD